MPSITIPDRLYDALKAEAAARGVSVDEVAIERLLAESRASALRALAESQAASKPLTAGMDDDEVLALAVAEVRTHRREKAAGVAEGASLLNGVVVP